jgi:hypothetical protein
MLQEFFLDGERSKKFLSHSYQINDYIIFIIKLYIILH